MQPCGVRVSVGQRVEQLLAQEPWLGDPTRCDPQRYGGHEQLERRVGPTGQDLGVDGRLDVRRQGVELRVHLGTVDGVEPLAPVGGPSQEVRRHRAVGLVGLVTVLEIASGDQPDRVRHRVARPRRTHDHLGEPRVDQSREVVDRARTLGDALDRVQ